MSSEQHTVVIIGGGTGGISTAALLRRKSPQPDIALIDPAEYHYYQPAWTLVGGGAYAAEKTQRKLSSLLPTGVKHITQSVAKLLPEDNQVELADGTKVGYKQLVVAPGIRINGGPVNGIAINRGQ